MEKAMDERREQQQGEKQRGASDNQPDLLDLAKHRSGWQSSRHFGV
jgi:hypothetical protein